MIIIYSININAHNTYHADNIDGIIGNRSMGWIGNLTNHVYVSPNNPKILYEFAYESSDMTAFNSWSAFNGNTEAFEQCINAGADIWNNTGIASIEEYNGYNPTGVVVGKIIIADFRNLQYSSGVAAVTITPGNTSATLGHVSYWKIYVNTNRSAAPNPEYIAHEFGHVMGLLDTGFHGIMYGTDLLTRETPTNNEIFGVSVMLGINHSWDYQVYNTVNGNSQHAQKCQDCNGYKIDSDGIIILSLCVYGNNGRCTYCGALPGTSINNDDEDLLIE